MMTTAKREVEVQGTLEGALRLLDAAAKKVDSEGYTELLILMAKKMEDGTLKMATDGTVMLERGVFMATMFVNGATANKSMPQPAVGDEKPSAAKGSE